MKERFAGRPHELELADGRLVWVVLAERHSHRNARAIPDGAVLARNDNIPVEDVRRAVGQRHWLGHKVMYVLRGGRPNVTVTVTRQSVERDAGRGLSTHACATKHARL